MLVLLLLIIVTGGATMELTTETALVLTKGNCSTRSTEIVIMPMDLTVWKIPKKSQESVVKSQVLPGLSLFLTLKLVCDLVILFVCLLLILEELMEVTLLDEEEDTLTESEGQRTEEEEDGYQADDEMSRTERAPSLQVFEDFLLTELVAAGPYSDEDDIRACLDDMMACLAHLDFEQTALHSKDYERDSSC